MKKTLCMLLAIMLTVSFAVPAFAAQDMSEETQKLILTAKEKLGIGDEYVISDYSSDDTQGVFYFSWYAREDTDNSSISVTIGKDGDIKSYSHYQDGADVVTIPTYDKEDAVNAAKAFVEKIAPDKAAKIRLRSVGDAALYRTNSGYQVTFDRYENGVLVSDNTISVNVHPDTLAVIAYDSNWIDGLTFQSPDGALDFDQAAAAFQANLGYELYYNLFLNDAKARGYSAYLAYGPNFGSGNYIDAFTGEKVNYSSYLLRAGGSGATQDAAAEVTKADNGLSPEEQVLVDEIAGLITKEDAIAAMRAVPEFELDDSLALTHYNTYKTYDGVYVASAYFSSDKKSADVRIDLATGEILSFSKYSYDKVEEDAEKIPVADAKATAEEFLNTYYAEKFAQTKPRYNQDEESYYFDYQRTADGVRVNTNGLRVAIDPVSGKLSSFSNDWTNVEFPSQAGAQPIDTLYGRILNPDDFMLAYVCAPVVDETLDSYDWKNVEYETHLVYTLATYADSYDADTLEKVGYDGKPVTVPVTSYDDISGHYVEPYAKALLNFGIALGDGSLNPDAPVTQKEYLWLISRVTDYNYDMDSDYFYQSLINRGIISEGEQNPDAQVTRMDAVRYAVNAKGYKDIAVLPEIFNCQFTDVPAGMEGYAALAGGMGIVSTDVDTLNADALLSRADALIIAYNFIAK